MTNVRNLNKKAGLRSPMNKENNGKFTFSRFYIFNNRYTLDEKPLVKYKKCRTSISVYVNCMSSSSSVPTIENYIHKLTFHDIILFDIFHNLFFLCFFL